MSIMDYLMKIVDFFQNAPEIGDETAFINVWQPTVLADLNTIEKDSEIWIFGK